MSTSLLIENVSVEFPVYDATRRSLKRRLISATTGGRFGLDSSDRIIVRALSDVSLSFAHGDRVALIGANGAGKTTMLRVLSGAYEPVRGRLSRVGSLVSLVDLSMGMDMEATGYENIRLRGMLMGLSPSAIDEKRDEIAHFTELGDFLDFPIRTYSAGMLMRLSFAIATCIKSDIILMDEWISVGDASFIEKAERRLRALISLSGILILASHSLGLVKDICNKAVLLDAGRVVAVGSIDEIVGFYTRTCAMPSNSPLEM